MTGNLTPHPIADIICAWANGFRVEFRYRHHNPGIPEEIYLSDERWHLCGKADSAWSGINEHRVHADDLAAWEAFKRTATPEDAKDAARYRWLRTMAHDWGICKWDRVECEWVRDSRGATTVIDSAIDAAMAAQPPVQGSAK